MLTRAAPGRPPRRGSFYTPNKIRVWDVKRLTCDVINGQTDTVFALAALPDGRMLSGSDDHTLKV